jgi:integrase
MRLLRALFNFAAGQYEDLQGLSLISENPVKRLSQTLAWYRVERRQSFIKAHELLLSRSQKSTNEYVFPGTGAAGHIIEPRKQMANVTKLSGIHFTVHDLRRTFITIAEGLDISAYALKRLMNHKMNGDITAGYIVTDVEGLRKPMQQITDYFLRKNYDSRNSRYYF